MEWHAAVNRTALRGGFTYRFGFRRRSSGNCSLAVSKIALCVGFSVEISLS